MPTISGYAKLFVVASSKGSSSCAILTDANSFWICKTAFCFCSIFLHGQSSFACFFSMVFAVIRNLTDATRFWICKTYFMVPSQWFLLCANVKFDRCQLQNLLCCFFSAVFVCVQISNLADAKHIWKCNTLFLHVRILLGSLIRVLRFQASRIHTSRIQTQKPTALTPPQSVRT